MARYVTTRELRERQGILRPEQKLRIIVEAQQRSPVGSTFLSHSSRDVEYLPAVITLLEDHGARVYIDKKDAELPPYTSRETAKILRRRIEQCARFLLLATPNSKDSRWMPWELGIADGLKDPARTAIFPAVDKGHENSWTDQEYLGVYDRVAYGGHQQYQENIWMVLNQEKNTATELSKWLGG